VQVFVIFHPETVYLHYSFNDKRYLFTLLHFTNVTVTND
jgi:hypothetical protein